MEGEWYCGSPDTLRRVFREIDPLPVPKPFCVVQPLSMFKEDQVPEVFIFFCRPEALCGLAAWPLRLKAEGKNKAVVGGWDPSARKFYKTDELSFTVLFSMFQHMLERYKESFLTNEKFATVRKKIVRSKKAWGEIKGQ